jgi:hypothetical protein
MLNIFKIIISVQRVEFNVNTKDTWPNWVLNLSAVDGINEKTKTLQAHSNPYAPLGTCNVYDKKKYLDPNIHIKINNVLDKWDN